MKGQWLGRFEGTNTGDLMMEFDEFDDHFEGRAYAFEQDHRMPSTVAFIRTKDKAEQFEMEVPLFPLNPRTLDQTEWEYLAPQFPGVIFPTRAKVAFNRSDDECSVTWESDIGTNGSATARRSNASRPSTLVPLPITTWEEFRKHFQSQQSYRYVFRGQENNVWRLQTSFHRTQRSDLVRYLAVDINALHGTLSSLTKHFFVLSDPIQNAAFMSLVQHHGYPTPLLDWTYSPFIAAYFAFKQAKVHDEKVRIFMLDLDRWTGTLNQLSKVQPARPHFSIIRAAALDNPRMVPQQALSSVTNVEDIEEYIQQVEKDSGQVYLQAVDLPVAERVTVLKELSATGIGPGSLFPGLDGACGQMRDRFFGID